MKQHPSLLDESGEPRIFFHGTNKVFSTFKPSQSGSFGMGIYFACSESSAVEYGGRIVQARVMLSNPWDVAADFDAEVIVEEDFDSPATGAVLLLPRGRALLEAAKLHPCGHFGEDLQRHLVELGYDGIVATYPDGCLEVVAFRPDQVEMMDLVPA